MAGAMTGPDIAAAARRVAEALIANAERFNALDAAGGDGDMGTTLAMVSRGLLAEREPGAEDVGEALMRVAKVIARISGSSLSAVVMTGLMAMSKACSGKAEVAWADLPALLETALETMQARSRARLGDKTVLDGIAHIAEALRGAETAGQAGAAAEAATQDALAAFCDRPAVVGRLRLEPAKGVGTDDPGMVALAVAISAMANPVATSAGDA
jgi:phosphoenolpyruvate---glycerone phosphotransferase subunit DhaL